MTIMLESKPNSGSNQPIVFVNDSVTLHTIHLKLKGKRRYPRRQVICTKIMVCEYKKSLWT